MSKDLPRLKRGILKIKNVRAADDLSLEYSVKGAPEKSRLHIALVDSPSSSTEETDKPDSPSCANVVRLLYSFDIGSAERRQLSLEIPSYIHRESMKVIAYLQDLESLDVVAAHSGRRGSSDTGTWIGM